MPVGRSTRRSSRKKAEVNNMSFSVSKYNAETNKFAFKLPEDAPFKKLEELSQTETYTVRGLWISKKSIYGDHPVITSDDFNIDLPKHTLDTVNALIADDEAVEAINAGKVGITVYDYTDKKYGKHCYGIRWVDINPIEVSSPTPFN